MKASIFMIAMVMTAVAFLGCRQAVSMDEQSEKPMETMTAETRSAVFAGGCFWCTESDFEKLDGVIEAVSGYTGGHVADPTYKQVSAGGTGHVEAIKVVYDPKRITYAELLDVFWRHVDPTDPGGQFVDRGPQYRSAIFYGNEAERELAEASKKDLEASGVFDQAIVTDILPLETFYPAEDYHQDYYRKNPLRYNYYRGGSGRDRFLEETWADDETGVKAPVKDAGMAGGGTKEKRGKDMGSDMKTGMGKGGAYMIPSDEELRDRLTPMQYRVTRENGTEPPFKNAYWDNHEAGIYVDVISGEPLFSSTDKFDSGTGWPSFTRPLEPENIVEKTDRSLFMVRTEVRSRHADSHLGHVFDDGPPPTGLRYCVNSAALRFVPRADLEAEGYGKYNPLFME